MSYTQTDLDNIRASIKSGSLKVKHRDREVTYRSLDEMRRIEAEIIRSLGLSGPRRNNPLYDSGL
jgi:hypothetical protein